MTTRLPLAILPALLLGCAAPKAIVVEEPKPTPQAAKRESQQPSEPAAPQFTLRDPDVVSELPESRQATPSSPAPRQGGTGTVIARPPAAGTDPAKPE